MLNQKQKERLRKIGILGGLARIKKYGNPGTPGGRRRGGLNSLKTHRKLKNGFRLAKDIRTPIRDQDLAEFMGIMLGDGHLSNFQVSIATNSETDIDHAHHIANLIRELFGVKAKISFKKKERAVTVVASSIKLVRLIHRYGMPIGNKLKLGLNIPGWIIKNKLFQKTFIKGLFDTDGCIYLDHHEIKNKIYKNLGWTITSYSGKLRTDVMVILRSLGYSPTCRGSQMSVYMRRKNDIERYFQEIWSNNRKHLKRYKNYYGRVPKRS